MLTHCMLTNYVMSHVFSFVKLITYLSLTVRSIVHLKVMLKLYNYGITL